MKTSQQIAIVTVVCLIGAAVLSTYAQPPPPGTPTPPGTPGPTPSEQQTPFSIIVVEEEDDNDDFDDEYYEDYEETIEDDLVDLAYEHRDAMEDCLTLKDMIDAKQANNTKVEKELLDAYNDCREYVEELEEDMRELTEEVDQSSELELPPEEDQSLLSKLVSIAT